MSPDIILVSQKYKNFETTILDQKKVITETNKLVEKE
jgi:hypothetical protein